MLHKVNIRKAAKIIWVNYPTNRKAMVVSFYVSIQETRRFRRAHPWSKSIRWSSPTPITGLLHWSMWSSHLLVISCRDELLHFLSTFFFLVINIILCMFVIGFVTLFIQYCYGIYNAATYQEYKLTWFFEPFLNDPASFKAGSCHEIRDKVERQLCVQSLSSLQFLFSPFEDTFIWEFIRARACCSPCSDQFPTVLSKGV